jgi:hypothetical protein
MLATPHRNGDDVSDAVAVQVRSREMAPEAPSGHRAAVFEAPHGPAASRETLAADSVTEVRRSVAKNENAPSTLRKSCTRDPDLKVCKHAQHSLNPPQAGCYARALARG